MSALHELFVLIANLVGYAFRPTVRLWPVYLVAMTAISFAVHLRARSSQSFLTWAFPKATYLHSSHRTDVKLFALGQLLTLVGFFKVVAAATAVATITFGLLDGVVPSGPALAVVPLTVLLVATADFTTYWVHRLHHDRNRLWPFHAVHHSAEVMTPFTVYRKHPFYDLISSASQGVIGGFAQGLVLAVAGGPINVSTIAGVNAGYFLFHLAGSNLRHTHIWLSYGPVVSRILISPAQHQIHHSLEPRHFNKNYGEVLAIWDWMFGTLYVPRSREELRFGLADATGNAIEQPHTNLRTALVVPIVECWRAGRRAPATPAERGDVRVGVSE